VNDVQTDLTSCSCSGWPVARGWRAWTRTSPCRRDGTDGGDRTAPCHWRTRRHIAAQFLIESASMGVVWGTAWIQRRRVIVVGVSAYQSGLRCSTPLAPLPRASGRWRDRSAVRSLPGLAAPPRSSRPKRSTLERDEMRLWPREMGRIFLMPGCTIRTTRSCVFG